MPLKDYPTVEYLRQCFREEDGRLFWLVRPREHFVDERVWNSWNARYPGKEAGHINKKMMRCIILINGKEFYRYWIIWALHKEEWFIYIDHINRNSIDDKIENLRPATQGQQRANSSINCRNTSGIKGIFWDKNAKKWKAQIGFNRKVIYLGYFTDKQEDANAYMKAAEKYFGEFATDGTKGG